MGPRKPATGGSPPPPFYNNGGSPPPFYNNGGGHSDECEGVCQGCYELCGEHCPCANDDKEKCEKWADENGCDKCFECHKKREQVGSPPPPFYNNGGGPPHGDECEGVCHGCYELCGEDCPCAKDDKEGCKKWADENGCNDCFECHKKREQGTEAKGEGEGEGKDEGEGEGEGKGKEEGQGEGQGEGEREGEKAPKEAPAAPAMIQQDPG